jgi:hypothetical protein
MAGRKNATFRVYDDLSLLFIAGARAKRLNEFTEPSHVDVRVIEDVARFVSGA